MREFVKLQGTAPNLDKTHLGDNVYQHRFDYIFNEDAVYQILAIANDEAVINSDTVLQMVDKAAKRFHEKQARKMQPVQPNDISFVSTLAFKLASTLKLPFKYIAETANYCLDSFIQAAVNYANKVVPQCPNYFLPEMTRYWSKPTHSVMFKTHHTHSSLPTPLASEIPNIALNR